MELQTEFNIELYDYGMRNYDPALGRWMNIDPLAEIARRWSPLWVLCNKIKYNNDEVYCIESGDVTTVPIDGINVNGTMTKITNGYNQVIINKDGSIETNYTNPFKWAYYKMFGGVKVQLDTSWDNLFNSISKE